MSYFYEARVAAHLYDVFRVMAVRVLERQGFRVGLHVASHEGSGVVEYHRDDEMVTFSTTHEDHDQRHLTVTSETVDVVPLVLSVVEEVAIDFTASFWAPATGLSQETLTQDVGRAIKAIWKRQGAGNSSK